MKKPVFTSLSPNLQKDDVVLARKMLRSVTKWQKGEDIKKLETELKDLLGAKEVITVDSGRTALYTILKTQNLEAGDEILLQAYACVAVPEPVLWTGATPIYVDCEEERKTMDPEDLKKKITKNSKVLIIQHTFGNPAKLKELLEIAKENNLFVIEDCAHALGTTYNGKVVGGFGDASFFSFGRDKVISSVFGGAIATNNEELGKKLKEIVKKYPLPSRIWIKRQLVHPIITWNAKKTYGSGLGKIILKLNKLFRLTANAVYKEERFGKKPPFIEHKLPNALASLARNQLKKLSVFNEHRKQLAGLYEKTLKDEEEITSQKLIDGSIYLRYTVNLKGRDKVMRRLKAQNIFLGDWYTTSIAPHDVSYTDIKYKKDCMTAESLAKTSLNLPTDINTTLEDAARIVNAIKEANKGTLEHIAK